MSVSTAALLGMVVMYYVVAEVDRIRSHAVQAAAMQLKKGYTSSIRDATCSEARDYANIHAEIATMVEQVDAAIDVLLQAGMSSPRLTRAFAAGVDVHGAAHAEYAILGPRLVMHILCATEFIIHHCRLLRLVGVAGLLLDAVWLLSLASMESDGRVFAMRVAYKGCLLLLPAFGVVEFLDLRSAHIRHQMRDELSPYSAYIIFVDAAFVTFFTAMQLDRVADLPCCGRLLAQWLSARGTWRCIGKATPDLCECDSELGSEQSSSCDSVSDDLSPPSEGQA